MNCINCENENQRDYPLCQLCETKRHFTNRYCRCIPCVERRCDAIIKAQLLERAMLAELAWQEEGRLFYGWPIQAGA